MTKVYVANRLPTSEMAAAHSWRAAPVPLGFADAGWCLVALVWGAVLVRLALTVMGS